MKKDDGMIFIDANQYLDLYALNKEKLIELLKAQQDFIFVTEQIVDEVSRRKLQVMSTQLQAIVETLPKWTEISAELLNISQEELNTLKKKFTKQAVKKAVVQMLGRISKSEDSLSLTLTNLFLKAHRHTPEELQRARDRKEKGNPPGKSNRIGDELSWEQLLSHYQGESNLWIITKDRDFCTKSGSELILNAFLHRELLKLNPNIKVFSFDNLAEGLEHFSKTTGRHKERRLQPKEVEEIKKEQESLPPMDWLTIGPNVRIWNPADYSRVAAFYNMTYGSSPPVLLAGVPPVSEEDKNK